MLIPLLAGALYCATPAIQNNTDTWVEEDQYVMQEMLRTDFCRHQNDSRPCMETFIKKSEKHYTVKCSPEKRRKEE